MKITPLAMWSALIFALFILLAVGIYDNVGEDKLYEDQVYEHLLSISESKADRVKDFLDNRKVDAVFLAGSEDVKNVFDEELMKNVGLMAAKIKNIAEDARYVIEEYLLEHPNMTLDELQNDEVFQAIAVQRVGETGYTFVEDYDSLIMFFHKDPAMVDFDMNAIKETLPAAWEIASSVKGGNEAFGFYDWVESDGTVREKYIHIFPIGRKTADGVGLSVGATTYIDEYGGSIQLASILDQDFKLFQQEKGYSDLILINVDGDVVWTAERHNELGTNLITGVYNESLLANVFNKVKKDLGVGVSDSEVYGSERKLNIFVTSPVMTINDLTGERELKGVLALRLNNEKIEDLITTDVGLGNAGEVYIVNQGRKYITSLKFDGHNGRMNGGGKLINSERIDACFKDYTNYYLKLEGEYAEEVEKTGRYLNYAKEPNLVLGAHAYVLDSGWCIISEMSEESFLGIASKMNRIMILSALLGLLIVLIISLNLDNFFKIKKLRQVK